ncbi:LytTR family transcriptional regulator DNA-binding domain-containing protein [Paenibacillus methanolicus]|uniref:LytTr DNA-binding domain-containing protein n=1 Tax=Paenibacillus methanolicus TaxID=582686 RepID=A0A5S5BY41_9BACL|nr:LytTR family transcriptional regulator DNA-binding domain-containing protein [Paenibacillus methanolicus]TYP71869.1 LytTr DNA-binding domain-containing protein [Paenibacillus methanolicus]
MMMIPVTRDRNNESPVVLLEAADILYIESANGALVFHTLTDTFYPLAPSLTTYVKHLQSYGFHKLDRINLVNKHHIARYDHEQGKVFFQSPGGSLGKSTTVAYIRRGRLRHEIERWIERNTHGMDGPY